MLWAVWGDIHGPFEDKRAVNLFLDVVEDLGISGMIINGDLLDFYALNSYGPKDPRVHQSLEDEFYWGQEFISDLRKRFPKLKIVFVFGNHEDRLDRFVMKNCKAFMNFLQLDKMLRLKEHNIEWIPYNERYQIGKTNLFVQHSPPSYSENAAATSMKKKIDQDHIWNCTHRPDSRICIGSSGKVYTSYINGWFGSKGIIKKLQTEMPGNRRVFKFTKNHESWARSFCLVSESGTQHHIQQVLIKEDYTCAIGENIYEG